MEPEDRPDGFLEDLEEPVPAAHVQQLVIGDRLLHMLGHLEDRRRNDDDWPAPSERDGPGDAVRDVDPGLDADARLRFAEGGGQAARALRGAPESSERPRAGRQPDRANRGASAQDQESKGCDGPRSRGRNRTREN